MYCAWRRRRRRRRATVASVAAAAADGRPGARVTGPRGAPKKRVETANVTSGTA